MHESESVKPCGCGPAPVILLISLRYWGFCLTVRLVNILLGTTLKCKCGFAVSFNSLCLLKGSQVLQSSPHLTGGQGCHLFRSTSSIFKVTVCKNTHWHFLPKLFFIGPYFFAFLTYLRITLFFCFEVRLALVFASRHWRKWGGLRCGEAGNDFRARNFGK